MTLTWRLLQLADSGFPSGGFAHSAGLEVAVLLGELPDPARLDSWVRAHLWSVGHGSLPFVGAAHDDPGELARLDGLDDAFLTNHVANRASRTQGRAFLATCARVFDEPALLALAERVRAAEVAAHLAPLFGATLSELGLARKDALSLHLLLALRSVSSAAVRLGVVGPHEAQRLQRRHAETMDAVLGACSTLRPEVAASAAPLQDVFGAAHDRLHARLFQS
ncbi:MAG: urease accessory protein UreF [Myxococcota bacterium]|nr:urease accessory protein UreF [Myxococcota bacterium]